MDNEYRFWLVQRLSPAFDQVDALTCEYMGSREFESAAIRDASNRLYTNNDLVSCEAYVTYDGLMRPVYFLGDVQHINRKVAAMYDWVHMGMRSIEPAYFAMQFSTLDLPGWPINSERQQTVAWWALDVDLVWTLERRWLDVFIEERNLLVNSYNLR